MTKTRCVGGRHYSDTVNRNVMKKLRPKTKKLVKIIRGGYSICGRNKSQLLTK